MPRLAGSRKRIWSDPVCLYEASRTSRCQLPSRISSVDIHGVGAWEKKGAARNRSSGHEQRSIMFPTFIISRAPRGKYATAISSFRVSACHMRQSISSLGPSTRVIHAVRIRARRSFFWLARKRGRNQPKRFPQGMSGAFRPDIPRIAPRNFGGANLYNFSRSRFDALRQIGNPHISRLRSKLGSGVLIRNIRGVGYSLRRG